MYGNCSDAELYEQLARAVEAMVAPEFAAKIRRVERPCKADLGDG
jgi:hypothetical protein